jgi:hypothetical protein
MDVYTVSTKRLGDPGCEEPNFILVEAVSNRQTAFHKDLFGHPECTGHPAIELCVADSHVFGTDIDNVALRASEVLDFSSLFVGLAPLNADVFRAKSGNGFRIHFIDMETAKAQKPLRDKAIEHDRNAPTNTFFANGLKNLHEMSLASCRIPT